jgi:hypothetical protein
VAPCDDVGALLKLYRLATSPRTRKAQAWVLTQLDAPDHETFQRLYPIDSRGWRRFHDACGVMELCGVLVKHELVPEALFFDLFGGIEQLWEAVAPLMPGMRASVDPRLYENFELLYRQAQAWRRERDIAAG